MRPLLVSLLVFSVLAAPAAARVDPPTGLHYPLGQDLRSPDARDKAQSRQDLRSPDTRDAAMQVPYGTPPASDGDTPWALLGVVPLFGGAVWAVRRRTARVRVAA